MKKIIGASVALFTLTSCGAPTIENPSEALQKNQSALIENIEKLQKLTPEQANSVGNIAISMEANEGKASGNIGYDFQANQTTYETAGTLTVNMNLEANDPAMSEMNMSGNLSLDLITLKNKILFKLNSLNLNGADTNPQLAMVTAMTAPFTNNWYFLENLAENPMMDLQEELLTKQKEIVALMKKHTILAHVSTNENADFYDYEVQLNEQGVINFMTELETLGQTEENTETILTQEEIDNIKLGVAEFNSNIKGNIKINKSNLEYFILTFTQEDGSVIIENTKNNFNITMNDTVEKVTASFLGTKSRTKFDAKISVTGETPENTMIQLIDGNMSFETDGETSDMILDLIMTDEYSDEALKINITASDVTTAQEVIIEEPTDAKNFEEVIMQMMGPIMGMPMDMETGYNDMHDSIDIENSDMMNGEFDIDMTENELENLSTNLPVE